jgi:pre-rRNA-processing protein IPI3
VSASLSHLQPVTSLVVDPTCNFILSGSPDANVHVWSLPRLLSFSKPAQAGRDQKPPDFPIRTFSYHRTEITALAVGHSGSRSNIAISAAKDSTAVVWDYHTGNILRIFLLPSIALCITVDVADRAFYAGYDTGGVQSIDFYKTPSTQHPLYDVRLQSTPSQISADDQWPPPSADVGAAECLTLAYDGMTLLSGHRNGAVLSWDVARGKFASTVADFTLPVTNLQMLLPTGFPQHVGHDSYVTVKGIIKPRYGNTIKGSLATDGVIPPPSYTVSAQLTPVTLTSPTTEITSSKPTQFSEALTLPFFPQHLIEEGLAELAAFGHDRDINGQTARIPNVSFSTDLVSMEVSDQFSHIQSLEAEINALKKRLSTDETARRATVDEVAKLRSDHMRLKAYMYDLQSKQEKAEREKFLNRGRREERDLKRREAWFEAEKQGQDGDALVRDMRAQEEDETTSVDDDTMSDED